jgi:hypothetical protein
MAQQRRSKLFACVTTAADEVATKHAAEMAVLPLLPGDFDSKSARAWAVASQCNCSVCKTFLQVGEAVNGDKERVKDLLRQLDGNHCSKREEEHEGALTIHRLYSDTHKHRFGRCVLVCQKHHPLDNANKSAGGTNLYVHIYDSEIRAAFQKAQLAEGFKTGKKYADPFIKKIIKDYLVAHGYLALDTTAQSV